MSTWPASPSPRASSRAWQVAGGGDESLTREIERDVRAAFHDDAQPRAALFRASVPLPPHCSCEEDVEDIRREVQIMHHLKGHPNITYLQEVVEDAIAVHLIMGLCSGGELFDRITERGHFSEADAAAYMRTIVSVVAHCHSLGVLHRDLKPENFLLDKPGDAALLKCTDFGLSTFFKPGEIFKDVVGSAYYVAPEVCGKPRGRALLDPMLHCWCVSVILSSLLLPQVLHHRYGPEADIWSCGVILYILLSGMPPFWGDTEKEVFDKVLKVSWARGVS